MKEKKENIKENVELLKKAWKNPKQKSIIKIFLYFIFILVLIFIVRFCETPSNSNQQVTKMEEKSIIDKLDSIKNYEYKINIKENENTINITGIKYNDINDFENETTKEKYTIENNIIYKKNTKEVVNNFLSINFNNLMLDTWKNYLTDENLKQEIKYENNEIKKQYQIKEINFIQNQNPEKYTTLTIYENENYINKVEIDITDIMKDINSQTIEYLITIEYDNINKIKDYQSS